MLTQIDLSFPMVKSVGDVVSLVTERQATAAPGEWILGRGWDEGKLTERRYVLASDLDAVTEGADNPGEVVISEIELFTTE